MGLIQGVFPDRETVLSGVSPWNRLCAASIGDLLDQASLGELARGDDVEADLGIAIDGAYAVERRLLDGRRVLCALFRQGDLIDLRRVERMRQGKLVALKPSRFLALDATQAAHCMSRHTAVADLFANAVREHFARLRDHAADLVCKTPAERIAAILFEFRRWPDAVVKEGGREAVRIPIQRSDIADYIGMKPETVSRAIRALRRDGLIAIPRPDRIVLADMPSLRRIANGGRPRRSTRVA